MENIEGFLLIPENIIKATPINIVLIKTLEQQYLLFTNKTLDILKQKYMQNNNGVVSVELLYSNLQVKHYLGIDRIDEIINSISDKRNLYYPIYEENEDIHLQYVGSIN